MADSTLVPSLIAAGSGLVGTVIGGLISYLTQAGRAKAEEKRRRISMATSLAAEVEAYLELMNRRGHSVNARALAAQFRAGQNVKLRGFALTDDTALGQFPLFMKLMPQIGELGSVCSDVAKFYTLIAGVRTTCIAAERGQYDNWSSTAQANLIEAEVDVWESALALGKELVPRLRSVAQL
jgi:hypothetical protein